MTITVHKEGACEALARVLHLWVAKREPYLAHLALSEEAVNDLDVRAQERHVGQSLIESLCGACPHA